MACKLYLEGKTPAEILMSDEFKQAGITEYQLKEWLEGSKDRSGLADSMLNKFWELNRNYCPFCDSTINFTNTSIPYPVHGNPCPCREKGYEKMQ